MNQTDTDSKRDLYSATKARKELDRDVGFQTELRYCLKNLE